MATTATFPLLQPPLSEDTMDIASPGRMDHDIEIDFDEQLHGTDARLTDDERMVEDGAQTRPGTATDLEMMEDEAPLQEAEMVDDFDAGQYEAADPDDELIDYDDEEFAEPTLVGEQDMLASENAGVAAPTEPFPQMEEPSRDGAFSEGPMDDTSALEQVTAPRDEHTTTTEFQSALSALDPSVLETAALPLSTIQEADDEEGTLVEPSEDAANALDAHTEGAGGEFAKNDASENAGNTNDVTYVEIEAPPAGEYDEEEMPGTPTDTGLHPMTVRYAEYDWPLFKSKRQPDGLLKDDNLVNLSLADLLTNCKQRIAVKLGEDISEEQEFVLAFDRLGLVVTQGSNACGSITLNEVLEVYTQLCANDAEVDDVPPLTLTLSLQLRFERHLSLLRDAATRGEGIPKLVNHTAEETGDEQYEDYHQDEDQPEEAAEHTQLDSTGAEDRTEYQEDQQEDREAVANEDIPGEEAEQAPEADYSNNAAGVDQLDYATAHYQADYAAQAAEEDGQRYDEEQDEALPAYNDEGAEGDEQNPAADHIESADEANQSIEAVDPADDADAEEVHDDDADEDHADEATVESGASSTTLRADQTEDITEPGQEGELDELDYFDDPEYQTGGQLEAGGDADEAEQPEHDGDTGYDYDDTHADALQGVVEEEDDHDNVDAYDPQADDEAHLYDEVDEQINADAVDADETFEADDDEQPEAEADHNHVNGDDEVFEDPNDDVADDDTAPQVSLAQPTTPHASSPPGPEDDIDFDDDTEAQHAAKTAANGSGAASPLGKRSFDEYENLYDDEGEPTPKKARAS